MKHKRGVKILLLCLLAFLGFATTGEQNVYAASTFKVHFIDVGEGDGALLQYGEGTNAKYALIDAGPQTYRTINGNTVDVSQRAHNYLINHGVTHLEFVLLTHPHQDHIGGMLSILDDESITIDTIYGNPKEFVYLHSDGGKGEQAADSSYESIFDKDVYRNVLEKIAAREVRGETRYVVPQMYESVSLGEATISFFVPSKTTYAYDTIGSNNDLNMRQVNKYSIVSKIQYGSNSFLMTGDAQKATIKRLISDGYDLSAQVLKVPHHGFTDNLIHTKDKSVPTDHALCIKKSKASISIISNGYKNKANLPKARILNELKNTDVYQTSNRGTIVITSDGTDLSIETQKGKNKPSHQSVINTKKKSSALMKKMVLTTNTNKKLSVYSAKATAKQSISSQKEVTVKIKGTAKGFTQLTNAQYKFVPAGKKASTVSYKTGKSVTIPAGSDGYLYVRYKTPLGNTEAKTGRITVSEPSTGTLLQVGQSTLRFQGNTVATTYAKAFGSSVNLRLSSLFKGKGKIQYKFVPQGQNESKVKWKTGNTATYSTRSTRVCLHVKFTNKNGITVYKKSEDFYIY